jgi:hypothetical protein
MTAQQARRIPWAQNFPAVEAVPDEAVAVLANIAKDRLPDGSHRVFSASVRNEKGLVILPQVSLCVPKTLSVLMEQWNHLSWWNDRAVLFRSGRAGLAVQVEVAA